MKMRGLALLAAAVLAATGAWAGTSQEKMYCSYDQNSQAVKGGDSVPWPWGNEIELPWDQLDGLWRVVKSDCDSYFAFIPSKKRVSSGTRLTQVIQYAPVTCEKIAWGYGTESDRVLRSSMSMGGNKSFSLTVRAFPRQVAEITPKVSGIAMDDKVIVLTMYPKRGWSQRVSYELEKVSKDAKPTCQTPVSN